MADMIPGFLIFWILCFVFFNIGFISYQLHVIRPRSFTHIHSQLFVSHTHCGWWQWAVLVRQSRPYSWFTNVKASIKCFNSSGNECGLTSDGSNPALLRIACHISLMLLVLRLFFVGFSCAWWGGAWWDKNAGRMHR